MPFCRSCGKELVAEAKFCPQCGTPAGSLERQLVVLGNASMAGLSFDLYFTESRIVGIHTFVAKVSGGGAAFGLLGSLAELGINKAREGKWKEKAEQMKDVTLDERVRADPNSFALLYSDVVQVLLNDKHRRILQVKGGKVNITAPLTKEQVERLKGLLPTIPGIAGKLKVDIK